MIPESVLKEWGIPGNVLKEWRQHGITLVEVWPDVLELRQHGEVVARFNLGFFTTEELLKEARKIIEGIKTLKGG